MVRSFEIREGEHPAHATESAQGTNRNRLSKPKLLLARERAYWALGTRHQMGRIRFQFGIRKWQGAAESTPNSQDALENRCVKELGRISRSPRQNADLNSESL